MNDSKIVYIATPVLRCTTDTVYTAAFLFTLYLKLKYWSDPHTVFNM